MLQSTTSDDLLCAECGYDLRTLPDDSNCPECGRAIIDSVNAGPLIRWISGFRRGVTFLGLAMVPLIPNVDWWLYEKYGLLRTNTDAAHSSRVTSYWIVIAAPSGNHGYLISAGLTG